MKSLIVLLFYCSIVLLLVASPVGAQPKGVDIGDWFKLGDRGIKRIFQHDPSECIKKCQKLPVDKKEDCIKVCLSLLRGIGVFISAILPNIYIIAGIILLFLLIFGGFTYIVNAGKQDTEGVQKGKNAITAAVIGFALIFGSWWMIQIIEIVTGIDILK